MSKYKLTVDKKTFNHFWNYDATKKQYYNPNGYLIKKIGKSKYLLSKEGSTLHIAHKSIMLLKIVVQILTAPGYGNQENNESM